MFEIYRCQMKDKITSIRFKTFRTDFSDTALTELISPILHWRYITTFVFMFCAEIRYRPSVSEVVN